MRILVTGGAGFIGHHVVMELERLGHECLIIDNMTTYGGIPEITALHTERSRLYQSPVHAVSISDPAHAAIVDRLWAQFVPDRVIHLASYPRQKTVSMDPVRAANTMIPGTIAMLEMAVEHAVERFVYISSSMVYGDFTEDVSEDSPCHPIGQYGIMKLAGEALVHDYARRGSFDHSIIRPSAVYGPRDIEDRVVNKFLLAAMRGETLQVRGPDERLDFTYVTDAAQGIVAATLLDNGSSGTYNITRSASHTLLEAAELAVRIAGSGSIQIHERNMEYPSRAGLNIDRARKELGYIPTVDIEQGFKLCHEWLKDSVHRSRPPV
jgi:nucleoside-diphosphate-sugar epimerase